HLLPGGDDAQLAAARFRLSAADVLCGWIARRHGLRRRPGFRRAVAQSRHHGAVGRAGLRARLMAVPGEIDCRRALTENSRGGRTADLPASSDPLSPPFLRDFADRSPGAGIDNLDI